MQSGAERDVLVGTFAITGFLRTTQMPEHRLLFTSIGNAVLAIVAAVRWGEVAAK